MPFTIEIYLHFFNTSLIPDVFPRNGHFISKSFIGLPNSNTTPSAEYPNQEFLLLTYKPGSKILQFTEEFKYKVFAIVRI